MAPISADKSSVSVLDNMAFGGKVMTPHNPMFSLVEKNSILVEKLRDPTSKIRKLFLRILKTLRLVLLFVRQIFEF